MPSVLENNSPLWGGGGLFPQIYTLPLPYSFSSFGKINMKVGTKEKLGFSEDPSQYNSVFKTILQRDLPYFILFPNFHCLLPPKNEWNYLRNVRVATRCSPTPHPISIMSNKTLLFKNKGENLQFFLVLWLKKFK